MPYSELLADSGEMSWGAANNPSTFSDVFSAGLSSIVADTATFRDRANNDQFSIREKTLFDNGLDSLSEARKTVPKPEFGRGFGSTSEMYEDSVKEEAYRLSDNAIISARTANPNSPIAQSKTSEEIRALTISARQAANEDYANVSARAESDFARYGGGFLGVMVGAMTDPINALTLPFGASAGTGILRAMALEGTLNMGIEALQTPSNMQWAKEAGVNYGLGEAAFNIGVAGIGGAGITGLLRGAGKLLTKGKSTQVLDEIASDSKLPSELREAAQYQSKVAHIDENTPIKRDFATDVEIATHRKNLQETQDAFVQGRQPVFEESIFGKGSIDSERIAINAEKIESLGYPEIVKANNLMREYSEEIDNLTNDIRQIEAQVSEKPEAVLDPATNDRIRIIEKELSAKNLSNKNKERLLSEKESLSSGTPLDERQVGIVEAINNKELDKKRGLEIKKEKLQRKLQKKETELKSLIKKVGSKKEVAELLEESQPTISDFDDPIIPTKPNNPAEDLATQARNLDEPDFKAALMADFQRVATETPDFKIEINGVTRSFSDIAKELKDDEMILQSIKTCGIG